MPRTKLQGNERGGDNNEYEKRAVSVYASGGEEAVRMTDGQAATLLLQHLQAGADADHRGAGSRAGGLRHQEMTALGRDAHPCLRGGDILRAIVGSGAAAVVPLRKRQ